LEPEDGLVRIVVLGNRDRGDDAAALLAADDLGGEARVFLVGRPGLALIDYLPPEEHCILLDVTISGSPPGTIHEVSIGRLNPEVLPDLRVSSHGYGPGEALALARALGRRLPTGAFLGIEGEAFEQGTGLSPAVESALPTFRGRIRRSLRRLKAV
jgi:hydrogenase maturation protease